ncbi:hypothetical protein [Rhodoligotrophos defluvii]|uniref:hypothetical protein n=1 Tax=Rhodoligotrophos defluvii TaxID=2561934 RepID=UPI0010C93A13|nr:hypothetical protein [Rhodoligotrophos defluvii]
MSTESPVAAPRAAQPLWPRTLLLAVAAIESMSGLSNSVILFGDMSEVPGPGLGGLLIKISLALHPLFAVAALVFVSIGWISQAILALAAVLVIEWLSILPSAVHHGLDFQGPGAVFSTIYFLALPALALAAAALVWRHSPRQILPVLLVSIPTLAGMAGFAAFALGVMIYGF